MKNVIPPEIKRPEYREELMKMKSLMYGVCSEKGWPAEKIIEDDSTDTISLIALNLMGDVVGALKVYYGDPQNFPIRKKGSNMDDEDAWPNLKINNNVSSEVALSVVERSYRGDNTIFIAMYAKMYWELKNLGIRYIYAILDRVIHVLYRRVGYHFVEIGIEDGGGRKIYWGEETFPAVLDLKEFTLNVGKKKPELWKFFQNYRNIE